MDAKVSSFGIPADPFADEPLRWTLAMDTASVPPPEQFDFYRTWHADLADVQLLGAKRSSFAARQQVWQLGDMALVTIECPGFGYDLRWEHRKRPLLDHWVLSVPFSRSPSGEMKAGKARMRCLALPDGGLTNDDLFVALFLPNTMPATNASSLQIGEATLRFLADYMLLLHRSIPDLRVADIPHVVTATTSLFAACLSLSHDRFVEAQHAIDSVIVERASKIIGQKLNDPNLTPDRLCRELGVSRSRLYRIFEPVGGVSNYIRRKRLLKTRDILADSSDGRPISTVAEDWGFTDPSTYSRMFRKEFGITPKEARVEGWRGVQLVTPQQISQPDDRIKTLSDLLLRNCFGP